MPLFNVDQYPTRFDLAEASCRLYVRLHTSLGKQQCLEEYGNQMGVYTLITKVFRHLIKILIDPFHINKLTGP